MKKRKRTLTLLEIMIVIFLITLITGAIGYNMRGTLDRGRVFRTQQAKDQLHDLLLICLADHPGEGEKIAEKPAEYLKDMALAKDPENLVKDGWGKPFIVKLSKDKSEFDVKSDALEKYENKKKKKGATSEVSDDDD